MYIGPRMSFRQVVLWLTMLFTVACLFLVGYVVSEISRSERLDSENAPAHLFEPDAAPVPPEELPDLFRDHEDAGPSSEASREGLI